jgi:anti-sigma28 factor (negative regulator of flagellin synthesis)
MGISEVTGSGAPVQPSISKKVKDEQEAKAASKDEVNVSEAARSLYETDKANKLSQIAKKVDEGFYSQHDVIEKVADSMLKDLKKQVSQ